MSRNPSLPTPGLSTDTPAGAAAAATLLAAVKRLDLFARLPRVFRLRGWALDDDTLSVVALAIACCSLGAAAGVVYRIPPTTAPRPEWAWTRPSRRAGARQIVERMDLADFLVLPGAA